MKNSPVDCISARGKDPQNQLHNDPRRMRRGCTVETDYAYDKLRKVYTLTLQEESFF